MDLRFDDPWALLLLLALPLLVALVLAGRAAAPAVRLGSLAPAGAARRTWRARLEPALLALRPAAAVLLVVALARPQHGEATTVTRGEGIDIVLALDTSSSMTQPFARTTTRLGAAEDVISRFVESRTTDRVGLVAFRSAALTLSPLTTDYDAVAQQVRGAGALRLEDGTAIGVAIGQALNLLRTSDAASRIVVLLTDGENNIHDIEPEQAAQLAKALGIRVYTVGVVSPGPDPRRATIAIDEASLRNIADTTGGVYNRAEDPQALNAIYARIDELERSRFEDRTVLRYEDLAPWVLAAAAAVLALDLVLRSTLFRRAS